MSMENEQFAQLKAEARKVLDENILRFWLEKMQDKERGGFYGEMTGRGEIVADAERGAILNARILWSFAAAYRVTKDEKYLATAQHAKDYILEHFVDKEQGGVFWSLDANGQPLDTKKQTYAIGFTIYGMSELARATGDKTALDCAIQLFHDIENHAYDAKNNGYVEALTRDWQPIGDMRLSDKDENASRTMNTHLHIIEPYTNLLRVWRDPILEKQTRNLLRIFLDILPNPQTHHLDLFFNDEWQGRRNIQSFGHDIEAVWLMHETAIELNDKDLLAETEAKIKLIAQAADEGLQPDGSMIYELWTDTGEADRQREWWVMCENIIGHLDLWQYFDNKQAFETALKCWQYTCKNIIDFEQGEWHWGITAQGETDLDNPKAGFWKCPYHNTRLCLEIIERQKK